MANLERFIELCSHSSKLVARGNQNTSNDGFSKGDLKAIKTKADILNAIENGDLRFNGDGETQILIKILSESIQKENKLTEEIGMVCQTLEMSKRRIKELESQNVKANPETKAIQRPSSAMPGKSGTGLNQDSFLRSLEELSQSYTDELNRLRNENIEAKRKVIIFDFLIF